MIFSRNVKIAMAVLGTVWAVMVGLIIVDRAHEVAYSIIGGWSLMTVFLLAVFTGKSK